MVELRFEGILDENSETEKTYQNTLNFVSREFEKEMNSLQKLKEEEVSQINKSKEDAQKTFNFQIIKFKEEILQEKEDSLQELAKQKVPIEKQAKKNLLKYKTTLMAVILAYCVIIVILIIKFGWDRMEPVTYIMGLVGLVAFYSYTVISGGNFNPTENFLKKEEEFIDKKFT